MSQEENRKNKFPVVYMVIMLLALVLVIIAMVSLKSCAAKLEEEANETSASNHERVTIVSQPIAQLMDDAPEGAGPFAVKAEDGAVYFLKMTGETQVLTDASNGEAIYEIKLDPDERGFLAGLSNGRALFYFVSRDTQLSHPRQAWEGVRQHSGVSISAPNLGTYPILHSEADLQAVLATIE